MEQQRGLYITTESFARITEAVRAAFPGEVNSPKPEVVLPKHRYTHLYVFSNGDFSAGETTAESGRYIRLGSFREKVLTTKPKFLATPQICI